MELPVSLPKSFDVLKNLNEKEVEERLSKDAISLTLFFEAEASDPIWRKAHQSFFNNLNQKITDLYLEGLLSIELGERIRAKVYELHLENPISFPKDLKLVLEGEAYEVNSLLFSLSSPYFNSLMTAQGIDAEKKELRLYGINPEFLKIVLEYVETGRLQELWKWDKEPILALLKEASEWEVEGMIHLTSENYIRYLNRVNIIDVLLLSIESRWKVLYEMGLQTLNTFDTGIHFKNEGFERLSLEFTDFREQALDIFYRLKDFVTDLSFHGDLSLDPRFSDILVASKKLIGLDISGTKDYSPRIIDVPKTIEDLNLSMCAWLNKENFVSIAKEFPHLKNINLSSNRQLDFQTLGQIRIFQNLEGLNLARCHQLSDDDLKVVIQATPNLIELNLEDSSKLTDHTFILIGKLLTRLVRLNLSKTTLTDIALIELLSKLTQLKELYIRRVPSLSDNGVLDALKRAPNLKVIDLSNSPISEGALEKMKTLRPFLKIIKGVA